jgi:tRNA-splicing ligase RtcB
VFKDDLELVYEISHNLVQAEEHPEFGNVWVHRKGATRAFPAGHPALASTRWEATGHRSSSPARTAITATSSCPKPELTRAAFR